MKTKEVTFDHGPIRHVMTIDEDMAIRVFYTNYEGKSAWRNIVPLPLPPTFTGPDAPYHALTWVLHVWDVDKQAVRSYALKDIYGSEPKLPLEFGTTLMDAVRAATR